MISCILIPGAVLFLGSSRPLFFRVALQSPPATQKSARPPGSLSTFLNRTPRPTKHNQPPTQSARLTPCLRSRLEADLRVLLSSGPNLEWLTQKSYEMEFHSGSQNVPKSVTVMTQHTTGKYACQGFYRTLIQLRYSSHGTLANSQHSLRRARS